LDRLSGLPLALTQAAAYIGQTAVSIVQYLEYYDSMWKYLMEQQDEYPPHEYAQRSVLTTWRISYEQVKSQSMEAGSLLQLWSFLYAGDLWYELVSCAEELGKETIMPDWVIVLAQDRLAFDGALRLLIKYSLVEVRAETASYAMHSVLHSWCRCLGASDAERDSFQNLAIDIVGWMVADRSMKEFWVLQRRLLPHGQAVFDSIKSGTQAETISDKDWAWYHLARMFADQDRYLEAEAMYKRALVGAEKALGPTNTSTLNTINNLGALYCSQGRLVEAEAMYERALAGKEKALGPTHTSTLDTINNLGTLYCRQGRLGEAEAMYERALAGWEKALEPTYTSSLDTINNLGTLYCRQGRLGEAEAMYERALAGAEKALEPTHTSTLRILHNLGLFYFDQVRLVEAETMLERALAGKEKTLGPTHTSTLDLFNDLGALYYDQGRLVEAEAMLERALAGREKALGLKHPSTLKIANNLANLHHRQAASQKRKRSTGEDLLMLLLLWVIEIWLLA
jgi:tetratricopeptide (TPR) repeat protein